MLSHQVLQRTAASRLLHSQHVGLCTAKTSKRHQIPRSRPQSTTDYAQQLLQCEVEGDWGRTIETLTEARVLKVQLPGSAQEAAIRTLAAGGQSKRAAELLSSLREKGHTFQAGTVTSVFTGLAAVGGDTAFGLQLLEDLQPHHSGEELSQAYNLVVRSCARAGQPLLDSAYTTLERMMRMDGVTVEGDTFSAVAFQLMRTNDEARAELVLEMRDYL